ncbi:hypothetical protein MP638_002135 [Amoeboaphelidium occidentale]|nr:hypothetical protein MP638_002135 [Amoeboaphelidium occidentale]
MPRVYSTPKPFASSYFGADEKNKDKRNNKGSKNTRKRNDFVGLDVYEDVGADNDDISKITGVDNYEIQDVQIDAQNDEEISEDSAFNESDDERFGDYFGAKGADKEEEEDSDFEDDPDAMDISEMFKDGDVESVKPKAITVADIMPRSQSSDEESQDEDMPEFSDEEDNDIDLSKILQNNELETGDAFSADEEQANLDEAYEGEFNLRTNKSELSLEDLVNTVDDSNSLSRLKSQVREVNKKKKRQALVSAPLPHAHIEKLERIAAYETASKEISKWLPVVQKNRKEESLSFPLNAPLDHVVSNKSLGNIEASNDLEKDIERILEDAGLKTEADIVKAEEELLMNKLDPEELKAQREEMRKMRALLFYAEQKEKRAAKIKSRKYRKIKKKDKERLAALEDDGVENDAEELEKRRALERMSLRHKSGSKWAKNLMGLKHDEETREAVMDQINRHEELMKKIKSKDDSDYDSLDEKEEIDEAEELAKISSELKNNEEQPKKGIFAMKFMKNAMEQQRLDAANRVDEMADDLNGSNSMKDDSNTGRLLFGPSSSSTTQKQKKNTEDDPYYEKPIEDETAEQEQSQEKAETEKPKKEQKKRKTKRAFEAMQEEQERSEKKLKIADVVKKDFIECFENNTEEHESSSNPWLSTSLKSIGVHSATSLVQDSNAKDDDSRAKKLKVKIEKTAQLAPLKVQEDNSEVDEDETVVIVPSKASSIKFGKQKELIKQVFANDDLVEEEFEQEKLMETNEDAPKSKDVTLPGWGAWGGSGVNPKKQKKIILPPKKNEGLDPKKRKDYKLQNVIINEKKDKKFIQKYVVSHVPHPYQSKQQYEAIAQQALGKEWNPVQIEGKRTKPKVIVKSGTVIDPVKYVKQPKDKK